MEGEENDPTMFQGQPIEEGQGLDEGDIDTLAEEQGSQNDPLEGESRTIDLNKVLQLGDRVIIDSEKHGFVVGTIYYRSGDLIRVKPDGASNTLIDFPRLYEGDKDEFVEELGVKAAYILKKRLFPDFLQQQDFRLGQILLAIDENGAETKHTITAINKDEDSLKLKDSTGSEEELKFGHVGIPPEAGIKILKIIGSAKAIQLAEPPVQAVEAIERAEGAEEETDAEATEADEDDEVLPERRFKIQILGTIKLPKVRAYKEETGSKMIIPQNIQKSSALNDMIGTLDLDDQKDEKMLRQIRIMVETFFQMKQDLIDYNPNGTVKGIKEISPKTLIDLIRLTKNEVPLGKAVLAIKKRLYEDPRQVVAEAGEEEEFENRGVFFKREARENHLYDMAVSQGVGSSSVVHSSEGESNLVEFYNSEQRLYSTYERPWLSEREDQPLLDTDVDKTFFRSELPDLTTPNLNGFLKAGPKPAFKEGRPHPALGKLAFGQERALSTTFRKGPNGKQALLAGEDATILFYLLFPQSVAKSLGSIRSGQISLDSGRGLLPPKTMRDLLQALGGIQDSPNPQTIVALGVEGDTLGNIPLNDYLSGLNIPGTGIGDTLPTLQDFGLGQLEFNTDILNLLNSKITIYQRQLKNAIAELREQIQTETSAPTLNPMIPLDSTILKDIPMDDAFLADDIELFKSRNPVLQKSDIALFASILRVHADYFQAILGQQPLIMAEQGLALRRSMKLEALRQEELLNAKKAETGLVPVPNLCEHVAALRTIRRIKDEKERYYYLTKFFAKYQGKRREDNWISCKVCEKELLCVHERLLIQAYLNPLDKPALLKRVNLNFSGGVFQGYYICRSCGQPIQQIGYDTNIQFDDEGRPMSGRAELVDKEALTNKEIEIALGVVFSSETEDIAFQGEQLIYYKIVRLLAERVGIFMEKDRYKIVIERVQGYINSLPSREAYAERQEELRLKAEAEKRPFKPGNYDALISRNIVCASAVFVLIEIQTFIPDYEPKFVLPKCVPGFGGYPVGPETDKQGIQYMVCNIGTIGNDEGPWNMTGYQGVKDQEKRFNAIQNQMSLILKDILSGNAVINRDIVKKQIYRDQKAKQEDEEGNAIKDVVPVGFLPELVVEKGLDAAAEGSNVAAAAAAAAARGDERGVAKAWIQEGHSLAEATANKIKGSLFSEITCCDINITTPGQFWASKTDMPKLVERRITPAIRARSQQVHFQPRKGGVEDVEIDKDTTYRLYLKFCFTGDNIGNLHEPGLTNLCARCGFQFPGHPSVVDPGEGRTAVTEAVEDLSVEGCQTLLDVVHRNNEVAAYKVPSLEPMTVVLEQFASVEPAPLFMWHARLTETLERLRALGPNADEGQMVEALGPFSVSIGTAETAVKARVDRKVARLLDTIAAFPWDRFLQVLETYLVVPFRKIASRFSVTQQIGFIPRDTDFSTDHYALLEKVIQNDNGLVTAFMRQQPTPFSLAKIAHCLTQISALLPFKLRLRPSQIPGRNFAFQYIQQALLFGPLAELLDTSIIPPNSESNSSSSAAAAGAVNDNTAVLLTKLINGAFMKFQGEQLGFNDEQLREIIQARNEKELRGILDRKTAMSDEERMVDSLLQARGMGRWAVIRADLYNPNQFDIERQQNAEAGIDEDLYGLNFGELGLGEGGEDGYDHGEGDPEFGGEDE
jgi:hypothetical protein